MSRIECPSEAWDRHCEQEERAHCPTDSEMLAGLDAYGHLTWVVGFTGEFDEDEAPDRGDWLACFDFKVFQHPDRGVLVAYHTVVDSDSGGFIDTIEAHVVEAAKAPFDLPSYWLSIGLDVDPDSWTEEDIKEAEKANTAWNADLRRALASTNSLD